MTEEQRADSFLKELKELFDKYEASLTGCGCCGSPYVEASGKEFSELNIVNGEVFNYDNSGEKIILLKGNVDK